METKDFLDYNENESDKFKQNRFYSSKRRIVISDKEYAIHSEVPGKSFRKLKKEDRIRIKKGLEEGISKIDKEKINELYHERLDVQVELFLTPYYLKKADIDNVTKTILDILNKRLWIDDRQIISLNAIKIKSKNGGILLKIRRFRAYRLCWA